MSVLRLFDSSQYIAAGIGPAVISRGVIEDQGAYRPNEMPCAGINCILNTIHEFQEDGADLVYCMDRPPIYKRTLFQELYPYSGGYKGNRPRKSLATELQRDLAEEILKQIGVCVIAADGYEADDCIASIIAYYKNSYEKVYLHTRDSDLFYLVQDNVEIMPVGNQGKHITLQNWQSSVIKGADTLYNTSMLLKLFTGEKGDNIPRISQVTADKIRKWIKPNMFRYCGNIDLVRNWIGQATNYDPVALGTYNLIVPRMIPYEEIQMNESLFRRELFEYYASNLGNKYYRNVTCKAFEIGEETIEKYLDVYNGGGR